MASLCTTLATNSFKIKNKEQTELFFSRLTSEDEVYYSIYKDQETDELMCDFASYGDIFGIYPLYNEDDEFEHDFDDFIRELQNIITDDTRVEMILNINERLRYVDSTGIVITTKSVKSVSMLDTLKTL